jgi:hypothetical protein
MTCLPTTLWTAYPKRIASASRNPVRTHCLPNISVAYHNGCRYLNDAARVSPNPKAECETPYHPGRSYTVDDWARIRDVYAATVRSGGSLTRAAAELAAALGRSPNAILQRFSMLRQGSFSRGQTGVSKRAAVCHNLLQAAVVSSQSPQSVQPESLTELEADAVDLVYRHFVRVERQERTEAAQLLHRTMGISIEKVLRRFEALGKAV